MTCVRHDRWAVRGPSGPSLGRLTSTNIDQCRQTTRYESPGQGADQRHEQDATDESTCTPGTHARHLSAIASLNAVESTWETRDLPVLDAAARFLDQHAGSLFPQGHDLAEMTGLSEEDVTRALVALDGDFLEVQVTMGGGGHWTITRVHSSGRFAIGQWPSPDTVADRLIEALNQAADRVPDGDERGFLKRTASWLGGAGRDVLVEVAAAVVSRSVTG
jgi:hypothetical protein